LAHCCLHFGRQSDRAYIRQVLQGKPMADEDEGPKPNRANVDDEFLRHPYSHAYIRNPLVEKDRSTPILFQEPEFKHNCLEEALSNYNCLTISESGFKDMLRHTSKLDPADGSAPASPSARVALSSLTRSSSSFDFVVTVQKSSYVPPRAGRRRQEIRPPHVTLVDKLNVEVTDDHQGGLRVEDVKEGLIGAWNRSRCPLFRVKPGDRVIKANGTEGAPAKLLEELEQSSDNLRLTIRRAGVEHVRGNSKQSVQGVPT